MGASGEASASAVAMGMSGAAMISGVIKGASGAVTILGAISGGGGTGMIAAAVETAIGVAVLMMTAGEGTRATFAGETAVATTTDGMGRPTVALSPRRSRKCTSATQVRLLG